MLYIKLDTANVDSKLDTANVVSKLYIASKLDIADISPAKMSIFGTGQERNSLESPLNQPLQYGSVFIRSTLHLYTHYNTQ